MRQTCGLGIGTVRRQVMTSGTFIRDQLSAQFVHRTAGDDHNARLPIPRSTLDAPRRQRRSGLAVDIVESVASPTSVTRHPGVRKSLQRHSAIPNVADLRLDQRAALNMCPARHSAGLCSRQGGSSEPFRFAFEPSRQLRHPWQRVRERVGAHLASLGFVRGFEFTVCAFYARHGTPRSANPMVQRTRAISVKS